MIVVGKKPDGGVVYDRNWRIRAKVNAIPVRNGPPFRCQSEQHFSLKVNADSGGKANSFCRLSGMALDLERNVFHRRTEVAAVTPAHRSCQSLFQTKIRRAVSQVGAVPNKKTKSGERKLLQRQRWFLSGQKWRTGSEGRISVLKRRHGLRRCLDPGLDGMRRWVGLGVIADNVIQMGCFLARQST